MLFFYFFVISILQKQEIAVYLHSQIKKMAP